MLRYLIERSRHSDVGPPHQSVERRAHREQDDKGPLPPVKRCRRHRRRGDLLLLLVVAGLNFFLLLRRPLLLVLFSLGAVENGCPGPGYRRVEGSQLRYEDRQITRLTPCARARFLNVGSGGDSDGVAAILGGKGGGRSDRGARGGGGCRRRRLFGNTYSKIWCTSGAVRGWRRVLVGWLRSTALGRFDRKETRVAT